MGKQKVLATYFTDSIGYKEDNLDDWNYWYSELSNNPSALDYSALGDLPYLYPLKITYKGTSAYAKKGNVGAGGPNHPKIDLHINLAKRIGFANVGLDFVTIEDV